MTKKKAWLLLFVLVGFVFMSVIGTSVVYAEAPKTPNYNNPNEIDVTIDAQDGIKIEGGGFSNSKEDAWNNFITQYKYVITGIAGIGAVSMIAFFIINFMKLGASVGNPQARAQALSGCLWTGIAASGLGAVTLIVGVFYSFIK